MTIERRKVERGLLGKGFFRTQGAKHVHYVYRTESGDDTSVRTHMSRGTKGKTLGDQLVAAMARQCGLSPAEFRRLVDCSLSRSDYEKMLVKKKVIELQAPDPPGTGA